MTKKENPPELTIQLVNSEEVDLLVTLARNTYMAAFGQYNKVEDMNQYLDERMTVSHMTKELETEGSYFYFARWDGEPVGYLKLNIGEAQNEPLGSNGLEIERIYVAATEQGKGIGQQLMDFTFLMAAKWQKSTVWLGVWDRNPGAIKFYQRNGFVQFGSHNFQLGNDLQTDLLMKLERDGREN